MNVVLRTGANGITDLEYDPLTRQLYFVALNQANGFAGELYAIGFNQTNGGFAPNEISTGADGTAFAVTLQEEVWRRDGGSWTKLPGSFQKIAVRSATEVWAIDAFANLHRWDGNNGNRNQVSRFPISRCLQEAPSSRPDSAETYYKVPGTVGLTSQALWLISKRTVTTRFGA